MKNSDIAHSLNKDDMLYDFEKGIEFIGDNKFITIFGSARMSKDDPAYNKTTELSYSIAKQFNIAIMTGGGYGAMESANKGAFLAGVKSFGINVVLPHEQSTNEYVSHGFICKNLFTRKVILIKNAVAFIAVNGGYGTLDEVFEILTLLSVDKMKPIPVIFYGKEFWGGIYEWIKNILLKNKYINEADFNNIYLTDNKEEVIDILSRTI